MTNASVAALRDFWKRIRRRYSKSYRLAEEQAQASETIMGIRQGDPKLAAEAIKKMKCYECGSGIWQDLNDEHSVVYSCLNPKCGMRMEILLGSAFGDDEEWED